MLVSKITISQLEVQFICPTGLSLIKSALDMLCDMGHLLSRQAFW